MNLRKHIQKEINRILSESDYLPLGAEYIKDAPYNQEEPTIRKGQSPKENKYSSAWYGHNAGFSILQDSDGKLYAFNYDGIDESDFEPYADREVVDYDEYGPDFADLELDGDTLARYVNDNLDSLIFGVGKQGEVDGKDIVSIDQGWKEDWLNYAHTKGMKDNNQKFIAILSKYNPTMSESLEVDSDSDSDLYDSIQNVMDSRGKVSSDELNDIAVEHGLEPDSDEFLNMYLTISKEAGKKFRDELKDDMNYVKDEFFDGEFPKSFEEFYNKFKEYSFDNYYNEIEVREEFDKLTKDPNQLSLFESKMPNEDFVKVVFQYDFPSGQDRLRLIQLLKEDFFGQALDPKNPVLYREANDKYFSTYIPKLLLDKFLDEASEFNPQPTSVEVVKNRFNPLTKELQNGQEIRFFDYTFSEQNPKISVGHIKYSTDKLALMKWDDDQKEAQIDKSMIDKNYFYHGRVKQGQKYQPGGVQLDPDYVKIIFDDEQFYGPSNKYSSNKNSSFSDFEMGDESRDSYEDNVDELKYEEKKEELRELIKKYKGKLEFMFGSKTDSDKRWYTLIPKEKSDDFLQAAYEFTPYEVETERNVYENKALNEIRKIVRGVINSVIK